MGHPYVGVLYAGLILTRDGPKLIEYNARFGDPECQVLMMRLKDDLVALLLACCDGTLDSMSVRWFDEAALTVVHLRQGLSGRGRQGFGHPRSRGSRQPGGCRDLPCRHRPEKWRTRRQWRAGAQRHGHRQDSARGPGPGLCSGRPYRLARRFLPTRHRLARHRAGRRQVMSMAARPGCRQHEQLPRTWRSSPPGCNLPP